MSERYIELTDRKWKAPPEDRAIKWSVSAKGNSYTTFRGFVIVIKESRFKAGEWYYMTALDDHTLSPEDQKWEYHGKFLSIDEAKTAAIAALRPKREPVPVPDVPADVIASGGRKIVLD